MLPKGTEELAAFGAKELKSTALQRKRVRERTISLPKGNESWK